jgi:hypothetical protein
LYKDEVVKKYRAARPALRTGARRLRATLLPFAWPSVATKRIFLTLKLGALGVLAVEISRESWFAAVANARKGGAGGQPAARSDPFASRD